MLGVHICNTCTCSIIAKYQSLTFKYNVVLLYPNKQFHPLIIISSPFDVSTLMYMCMYDGVYVLFFFSILDLWNIIFLGSNLCLFLLLPFAYFFYEAEGLPGTRRVCP